MSTITSSIHFAASRDSLRNARLAAGLNPDGADTDLCAAMNREAAQACGVASQRMAALASRLRGGAPISGVARTLCEDLADTFARRATETMSLDDLETMCCELEQTVAEVRTMIAARRGGGR